VYDRAASVSFLTELQRLLLQIGSPRSRPLLGPAAVHRPYVGHIQAPDASTLPPSQIPPPDPASSLRVAASGPPGTRPSATPLRSAPGRSGGPTPLCSLSPNGRCSSARRLWLGSVALAQLQPDIIALAQIRSSCVSLVVKPATVWTVLTLAVFRGWPVH
jgi:hypothetical protein